MGHPDDKIGLKGMSLSSIKKIPSLIPLYVCLGFGVVLAVAYPLRCLFKAPEVQLFRHRDSEPWQKYESKQYKFLNPSGFDYENYKAPHPKY